jgi:hypothetical protein
MFQVRRGIIAVCLLYCMLPGPHMLLLDVLGEDFVKERVLCHVMLLCHLTLPTENNCILRIHSVNNGIYVQTDVGCLYPNSCIQVSPTTTTCEMLGRSLLFKPCLP